MKASSLCTDFTVCVCSTVSLTTSRMSVLTSKFGFFFTLRMTQLCTMAPPHSTCRLGEVTLASWKLFRLRTPHAKIFFRRRRRFKLMIKKKRERERTRQTKHLEVIPRWRSCAGPVWFPVEPWRRWALFGAAGTEGPTPPADNRKWGQWRGSEADHPKGSAKTFSISMLHRFPMTCPHRGTL